jgi:hypothetical protein
MDFDNDCAELEDGKGFFDQKIEFRPFNIYHYESA